MTTETKTSEIEYCEKSPKSGIVYILTNESTPGQIKIGYTTGDIKTRMASLYNTSVSVPFELNYAVIVNDCKAVEKILHSIFFDERVNMNREYFKVKPEKVIKTLELCKYAVEKIIPTEINIISDNYDIAAINKSKLRKLNININKLVNIGSILTFTKDESITAIVLENNKIEFNGEITTISGAAKAILGSQSASGSIFWKYNGKTLDEIRNEIENF